ncbi:glycosyl hydrolase family 28-related protein [Bacillus salipaludis]|uniref:glycosyl hydrolase family 28-related protein n=1 Tax=Bacillus salipaludis TaxID=2547811 RepID=UPI002E23B32D|nr:right-handed parallel beta-helix repeat-containing protein [Bacillus salipaludis]
MLNRKLSSLIICTLFILPFFCPGKAAAEQGNSLYINVKDFGASGADTLDDTKSIQKALNQANLNNGALVVVPDGEYLLSGSLKIGSNTHLLLSDQTVFKRNKAYTPMIRNNTKGAAGYLGNHDITIEGGMWEGNSSQFPSKFNHMTFGHAKNIVIKNTRLFNSYGSHDIELAGVQNGKVLNNYIEGYRGEYEKEAIQLDIVHNAKNFPGFGEYDNTPCNQILIEGNTIVNHSRGIGNHTSVPGVFQTKIKIYNNHFKELQHEGIDALDFNKLYIRKNSFEEVGLGIEIRVDAGIPDAPNIEITNNQIRKTKTSTKTPGNGIILEGNQLYPLRHVKIIDNVIMGAENDGIYVQNTTTSFVIHNRVFQSGGNGISLHLGANQNMVQHNILELNKKNGISIDGASMNRIEKNQIYINGADGIHISPSSPD